MQKTRNSQRETITPIAGVRVRSRLNNGFKNYWLRLTARATVDVSVAPATSLRNRGSVWALFDEIGLDENGRDRHLYEGGMFRFLSEMHAPSSLSAVRAAVGIATYQLEEQATMFFAHPLAAAPEESIFREIDTRQELNVFAKLATGTLADRLFVVGGATVAVTAISLRVQQIFDDRTPGLPKFIATARQVVQDVPGTNANFLMYLKTSQFLRALAVKQETSTVGEVSDIITALALRGDNRDIIGPAQANYRDLVLSQEAAFGGLVASGGYLGLNFQDGGKLSNIINPSDDVNLRLDMSVAASASAGTSRIRVALLELERTAGLVTETLGFPV